MSDYDMSIHGNPDAKAWAEFFIKTKNEHKDYPIDLEIMIGWFANAMMAMHDHIYNKEDIKNSEQKIHSLESELKKAQDENKEMRDAIKNLDFCDRAGSGEPMCSFCFMVQSEGHMQNCRLWRILKDSNESYI